VNTGKCGTIRNRIEHPLVRVTVELSYGAARTRAIKSRAPISCSRKQSETL
jgi:hypothetical protein